MTLCVLLLAASVLTLPASADLIGWWRFDEGAGTIAFDSSSKGQNGTLTNGPNWYSTGMCGSCLRFDGTDDCVIATGTWSMPQYTVSLWFRQDRTTGDPRDLIVVDGPGYATGALLQIGSNGTLRFLHRAPMASVTMNANESLYSFFSPTIATWHHVAAVKNAAGMVMYFDGQQAASRPNVTVFDQVAVSVYIGALGPQMQEAWPGLIDDVKIFDSALSDAEVRQAMAGVIQNSATRPSPTAGATDVPRDVVLGWKAGPTAIGHDVYFGTSFQDVNSASRIGPGNLLVSQGHDVNTYDPPGDLDFGQTCYWRVDEINAPDGSQIFTGTVWSFTVEPKFYTVTGIVLSASSFAAGFPPNNTVNGSGLDASDRHGTDPATMWQTAENSGLPAWIQYDLGRVRKVVSMIVWNYNGRNEGALGMGAKGIKVEYSADTSNWTQLNGVPAELPPSNGDANIPGTPVDFDGAAARYVKITIDSTWAANGKQTGLSEVRFLEMIDYARNPAPASGATRINPSATLSWRPGREAAFHNVYIDADPNALTLSGTAVAAAYTPANLILGARYYWRVDEVDASASPITWTGDLWDFTTVDSLVVDDIESYGSNQGVDAVFDYWTDGFVSSGVVSPTNGALVGYDDCTVNVIVNHPDFLEPVIVNPAGGGSRSMPFRYGQSLATVSEATLSVAKKCPTTTDWTKAGVRWLVLYFRGNPTNTAGQLYVKVNDSLVNYPKPASDLSTMLWNAWCIDLSTMSGTDLTNVATLTIGVSGSGARGVLYIDDIRLWKVPPTLPGKPEDPGTRNLMALFAMEGEVTDSSGHGYTGMVNDVTFVTSMAGLGTAAQFNGMSSHVDMGTTIGSGLIRNLTSVSFAVWVNYPSTANWHGRVFDFGIGSSSSFMYLAAQGATRAPEFCIRTATQTERPAIGPRTASAGWHHVAVVVDASGGTPMECVYLDGDPGAVVPGYAPKDMGSTTNNWLGRSQFSTDPYLNASIDDLRIYNIALSPGQIRWLAGDR